MNIVAVGFAFDTFQIARRPFAWITYRAQDIMKRTMVVQLAILLGMGISVFADHGPAAFFNVFLVLKMLADLSGELPQWNPKEPPRWLAPDHEQDWRLGFRFRRGHEEGEGAGAGGGRGQ